MTRARRTWALPGLFAGFALAQPVAAGERLLLPDVQLTDHTGRQVSLREVVGERVAALQFVFTRCGAVCPPMGAQFGRLQSLVDAGRFRLVSVSIDPEHDTPERLAAWGRRFGAGPDWVLLTGRKEDVDRVQKACGVFSAEVAAHSPTAIVVDGASGRFTRVSGLAAPQAVAQALETLAAEAAHLDAP